MATTLFTPILNTKTRAPNFFNGRLLSGEAMTDEQRAQKIAHELLAQSLGDGVVYGLTLEKKSGADITNPIITVKSGVAINRCGEILLLANDTDVQLVRPAHVAAAPKKVFGLCDPPIADVSCSSDFQDLQPPQSGTYVADDGVYLLTICSIGAGDGLATVSGLGTAPAACNIKYVVDAVEFRLLELPASGFARDAYLRNRVAYACFGVDDMLDYPTDPFDANANAEPHTLLDDTTDLTTCDVPLGVMYWTATGGIQFLDMWSVRRRVAHRRVASLHPAFRDRRRATGEAMVLQFQEEVGSMALGASTASLAASSRFKFLPPLGMLPIVRTGQFGFDVDAFFAGVPHRDPEFVDAADVESLFDEAVEFPAIDLSAKEFVWVYGVFQNQFQIPAARKQYALFASPHSRYRATARFDLSHWDFSNFTACCETTS